MKRIRLIQSGIVLFFAVAAIATTSFAQPQQSAALKSRLADPSSGISSRDMSIAAEHFVSSLSPDFRSRTVFAFDGPEMKDWHFVPRKRPGLSFATMTNEQRIAARDLLRTALSPQGMLKCESIMMLDSILHDMEIAGGGDGAMRDPLNYSISIFGSPTDGKPWAWRLEGHHLCLNFTSDSNAIFSVTPAFLGSNPAEVKSGPKAGLRVLAAEEDLARELMTSLNDVQRRDAIIAKDAPADILTLPGRSLDTAIPDPSVGISAKQLTASQLDILHRLLREFTSNMPSAMADQEMERIQKAGFDSIRFAWAGSIEAGKGHYYRLVGPTFVIEYDNTQNAANHVHTIWHDRERDFGRDLLREHLEQAHDLPQK